MFSLGIAFLRAVSQTQGQGMVSQVWSPPAIFQHIQPAILEPGKSPENLVGSFPFEDGVWNPSCHSTHSIHAVNLSTHKPSE